MRNHQLIQVAAIALRPFDGLFTTVLNSMNGLLDMDNELDAERCQTKYKVYIKAANSNYDSETKLSRQ
ncbi:MAG: hypothetical protein RMZ41_024435 [Nostoc sp. DedVER02]|uniref:hypothetical protein n=1 Tax=Nostoc sp. DedVER02 TaxID=3075405 RepID=UPI002AD51BCF|nr:MULTISPECIES: hypothetical protein [unclassified Nostoc]MDZ7987278.1 hypothetical protein [Nostoc sp. DedVER02]MDZ8110786.1 hypothetical protein [Nostoc sp. DedVER01b]